MVSRLADLDPLAASRRDFVIPIAKSFGDAGRALIPGAPGIRILASRDGPGSALGWMEAPVGVGWAGAIREGAKALRGDWLGRRTASHR